jgi:hypothetical protein
MEIYGLYPYLLNIFMLVGGCLIGYALARNMNKREEKKDGNHLD